MAVAHEKPRQIGFELETAFATAPDPAAWTYFLVTNIDTTGLVEQTEPNENNVTRPRQRHDNITTRRNSSAPFGTYLHGRRVVTDEGAQATTYHLAELAYAALGGKRLGWAVGIASGTAAAPVIDADPGLKVGDFVWALQDSTQEGQFYRIIDISGTTITPDRPLHFTPDVGGADTFRAVICIFVNAYATTQHTHADHKTFSMIVQGDLDDDVQIARGCKPTMKIEPLAAGTPMQISFECAVTTFEGADESAKFDFSASTLVGESPLVPGQGTNWHTRIANVGDPLADSTSRGQSTVDPGVAYEAVEGSGGVEGILGYVDQIGQDSTLELIVPFDAQLIADFRAKQHKHLMIEVVRGVDDAVGFYFPNLEISEEPPRSDEGSLTGVRIMFRAHENNADPGALTGTDLEQWRAGFHLLLLA